MVRKIDGFAAQDLANTSWAYAKLGLTEDEMFDAISAEVYLTALIVVLVLLL